MTRTRAAIVEDDELIRGMVALHLKKNGFQVTTFASAEEFLGRLPEEAFDVLVLDILLPGRSGAELLRMLRQSGDDTPVLMLTARSDVDSRLAAFRSGADDYLGKPFSLDELLARLRVLFRRSTGKRRIPASDILIINGRRINFSTRICECPEGEVALSEKEIGLLRLLTEKSGTTLSRADILEEVWGMDVAPTPRTVDNFILRFRKLFEDDPEKPRHFLSQRGRGYRFER